MPPHACIHARDRRHYTAAHVAQAMGRSLHSLDHVVGPGVGDAGAQRGARDLRHLRGEAMPWSQLCSATGSKRVVFEWQASGDESTPRAHAFEQCASCALHHDGSAPPAAPDVVVLRADLGHAVPLLFLHAPRPQHAWRTAQPRAPPAQA